MAVKQQRGLSLLSVLIVVGLLAAGAVLFARILPGVLEYQAAVKAINKAREGATVVEVRSLFDRAAEVDDITSIGGKDLEITKEGEQVVVSFAYDKEYHLFGPAWLTLKYTGTSRPGR